MAATSISIQVDIPRGQKLNLDELRHQVSLYAQFIINQGKRKSGKKDHTSLLSLRGILKTDKTDKELMDEYFKEKYGL